MTTETPLHQSPARAAAVQSAALAVACPKCNQPAGGWCRTAKGQKLPALHAARLLGAIPALSSAATAAQPEESNVSKSKLQATTAKNRREPGSRPAAGKPLPKKPDLKAISGGKAPGTPAPVKQKSKSQTVHDMLTTARGATRKELSEATGWPSVNLTVAAARADMVLEEDEKTGRCKLVAKAKKS